MKGIFAAILSLARGRCRGRYGWPRQATAQVVVTDEEAASGSRSLKIRDAEGLAKPFYPSVMWTSSARPAKLRVAFSLRFVANANLWVEGRRRGELSGGRRCVSMARSGCGLTLA